MTWLLIGVVVLPTTGMFAIALPAATVRWTERASTQDVRRGASETRALVQAQTAVNEEVTAARAIAAASAYGIGASQLGGLFGVDFEMKLADARRQVDQLVVLRSTPALVGVMKDLDRLRADADAGVADDARLAQFSTQFQQVLAEIIRDRLEDIHARLRDAGSAAAGLHDSIDVVERSLIRFQAALDRVGLATRILMGERTPAASRDLLEADAAFTMAGAEVIGEPGSQARDASRALANDPITDRIEHVLALATSLTLSGEASPYADDVLAFGRDFVDSVNWISAVNRVAQASAADLADGASASAAGANRALWLLVVVASGLGILAMAISVALARSAVGASRRLSRVASDVTSGNFHIDPIPEVGPREAAGIARAVNGMTATLAALETYVTTLAQDPRATQLDVPLPGPMGQALQATVDRLRASIDEREESRQRWQEVATHDGLTGLLTRGAAFEDLERTLARAVRDGSKVVALFVDLDDLKVINDEHGHALGDEAIRRMAAALRAATRQSDLVARIGGDEFLVVSTARPDEPAGEVVAERILAALAAQTLCLGGVRVPLGCSIGVATAQPGDDADALVRNADVALYRAKGDDHHRIAISDPGPATQQSA